MTVPPRFTRDAVFETIDAGGKLVVVVTERIRAAKSRMVDSRAWGARIVGELSGRALARRSGGLGGNRSERAARSQGSHQRHVPVGRYDDWITNTLTAAGLAIHLRLDRRRRDRRLDVRRAMPPSKPTPRRRPSPSTGARRPAEPTRGPDARARSRLIVAFSRVAHGRMPMR
jgi:hypothetical protein